MERAASGQDGAASGPGPRCGGRGPRPAFFRLRPRPRTRGRQRRAADAQPRGDVGKLIPPSDSLTGANFGNFREMSEEVFTCFPEKPVIALPKRHGRDQTRRSFHRRRLQNVLLPSPGPPFAFSVHDRLPFQKETLKCSLL